jgi:hypothetical protein
MSSRVVAKAQVHFSKLNVPAQVEFVFIHGRTNPFDPTGIHVFQLCSSIVVQKTKEGNVSRSMLDAMTLQHFGQCWIASWTTSEPRPKAVESLLAC